MPAGELYFSLSGPFSPDTDGSHANDYAVVVK
jgi:hypothetical protein